MSHSAAACPLCGAVGGEVVYDLSAADGVEDVPGAVVRCRSCPMWFKVLSDPAGLPNDYPGESGDDQIAATYLRSDATRALFRKFLADVPHRSGAPTRLLDIGAAEGVLIEEALRLGFAAEGLDHSAPNVHAARAKGLMVHHAAAEDFDACEAFEVITMFDFIEHVTNPLRILQQCERALIPGGELVVFTPNHRGSVVGLARLLAAGGIRYPIRQIFGRNHVCFFDDRSLAQALARAGFAVRHQRQVPYDPRRPGQYVSPLNLAALTAVDWLGRPFGRAFRLLVYARKTAAV